MQIPPQRIRGQTGLFATVRRPTVIQAGEGGFPEDVLIRPHRQGGIPGGSEGSRIEITIVNQISVGPGTDPEEVANAVADRTLERFREDLRFGESRVIIREEILDETA